ncbi:MAG: Lrp/AsnC family transcriptional regulator [Legionellaceae bacterium]|nr:Lrp/AsnC family transcriptional regulator [Legionellaceae bacterium]
MKKTSKKTQKDQKKTIDRNKPIKLDKIDKKILNLLQKNNQLTNLELAALVNISPPPCLRRVRRLRELGIIVQDVSLVDPFKINQNLIVAIHVSLEKQSEELLAHFEQKMQEYPEIKQCYFISGEVDYLLMVHVADIVAYDEFIRRVLVNYQNVKCFKSSFCLTRIKLDTSILLDENCD